MTVPTIISGRYKVIKELGSGGFGVTFLAEDTHLPSQRVCVVKKLKPMVQNPTVAQLVKERFQREAVVLEELGAHPQIPQLFAYFEEDHEFYLVQEYIEGLTLENFVQQMGVQPEAKVQQILADILNILEFIQTKKIIHRDIKPENIILRASDHQPTLIDFGAVREIMGTQILTSGGAASSIVIGTPGFMPAEQASGRPIYASDLYALAFTMIYLLTGHYPQNFAHDPLTGELDWHSQYSFSSDFVALLNKAIQTNQKERFLTATAMKQVLLSQSLGQGKPASTVIAPVPQPEATVLNPDLSKRNTAPTVATPEPIKEAQVTVKTESRSGTAHLVKLWLGLTGFGVLSFAGGLGYLQLQQSQARKDSPIEPAEISANDSSNPAQNLAVVFDPPSNVRDSPNGNIICSVKNQATINIYESEDDWHETDVCGVMGVIHISQIQPVKAIAPQLSETGVALVVDPPSNIRDVPNGKVLCTVNTETPINIFNSGEEWLATDFCGTVGFIHSSQLSFQN